MALSPEKIAKYREAERRGILSGEQLDRWNEAKRRGLVPEERPIETQEAPPVDSYNEFGYVDEGAKYEAGPITKKVGDITQGLLQKGVGVAQGAVVDPVRAGAQLLGTYSDTARDFAEQSEKSYRNFRTDLAPDDVDWSRLVGNIASPAGVKGAQFVKNALPNSGRFLQGAGMGLGTGLISPLAETEGLDVSDILWEKAKQLGLSTAVGGALNPILAPASSSGQARSLAANRDAYSKLYPGAYQTPGMRSGLTEAEDKLTSTPFVGSIIRQGRQRALEEQNLGALNRALEPAGIKLDQSVRAGREAFDDAYTKLSDKYDEILDKTFLKDPASLREKIFGTGAPRQNILGQGDDLIDQGSVGNQYQMLSEAGKKRFDDLIEKGLFQKFGKDPQGQHSVRMTGRQFKQHEESLKKTIDNYMQGTGEERAIGNLLKDALSDVYNSLDSDIPGVAKKLKDLNKAYAQYKVLEKASTSASGQMGIFTPIQGIKAATSGGNTSRVARGKGLMQNEMEVAQNVLGRTYPDSGTAGRLNMTRGVSNIYGGLAAIPTAFAYSDLGSRAAGALGRQKERLAGTRVGKALGSVGLPGGVTRGLFAPGTEGEYENAID